MNELPSGWEETSLGDVTNDCLQKVPAEDEAFLYVDIASVDREKKLISNPQELLGKDAPSRARKLIRKGDVLVSMTRPNLNAVAIVPEELAGHIASTGFDVLRAAEIDPRWVFYAVRSTRFIERMGELVQGALYPAVRGKDIRSYDIPLAPLPEQKRIADKLDSVLARVDACRDRLDRLPALLKRFRQSILAAATSGRLTEDWRTNRFGILPVALEGKSPLVIFESDQETLVANWTWERLTSLAKLESGHTPRKSVPEYWENGTVPWISLQDIRAADGTEIFETKYKPTELGIANSSARLLPKGTVCFCRDISFGYVTIMGRKMSTTQHFANWVCGELLMPKYLMYSFMAARNFLTMSGQGTTVTTIYMPALKELRLATPPLEEQIEIVRRVELLFAFADRIEARLAAARKQVGQLTPALLAKAFRGELVAQDPADEPAAELLKRLAAQRAAAPKVKRGRSPA